jgi:hypothetical protein
MNGTAPDIQLVRPFNEAVELTKQILFRPFDLKKWFIIGFAAWLSHLGGGGGGGGFNNFDRSHRGGGLRHNPAFRSLSDTIHHTPVWLTVLAVAVIILVILCLALLFAWLRARGRFMFTDCVVRNRAAVAEPWNEFRKLGNSFFMMSLLVALGFLVLSAVFVVPIAVLIHRSRIAHHHLDGFLIAGLILWVCLIFILAIAWGLIGHFMIPIMYRRHCLASEAFRAAITLINNYPGEITLYCLFWIALGIGTAVAMCVMVCLTCCIAAIPYIGTVIALPIYVCIRAFGLLYLRQFGPDYDVWATLPPLHLATPELPPVPPVG